MQSWFEILKLKKFGGYSHVFVRNEKEVVDLFALIVKNRLEGKDWDASPTGNLHEGDWRARDAFSYLLDLDKKLAIINFDPHNPQEIINEAKKLKWVIMGWDRKYDGLDLNEHLQYFIAVMKTYGYNMEEFKNVKGLLPQEATGSGGDIDLTSKIKDAVKMLKHMNKPITKESVLDELEIDERMWKEEYDKLLRE